MSPLRLQMMIFSSAISRRAWRQAGEQILSVETAKKSLLSVSKSFKAMTTSLSLYQAKFKN